ncbi:MAG: hypothetical protein C0601_03050 [Candidatus Muiribacterium halophilum]|uniref:Cyclodeaminase/cyclohydrolase domain-containing protein n=1 Tax=Muiribacterium halophilum TaxID=2053465 RepID=A0A2N5ZK74_MUIH1|nr:MAG: hypothetical protein C0601_03050 [Candidatus Muirbacterium halophilum]
MFDKITIKEFLEHGAKDINGPSSGVFTLLTYLQGIGLISKACVFALQNISEKDNKIYKKIMIRCEEEIERNLSLAQLEKKYFSEFINSSKDTRQKNRKNIDIVPNRIIVSAKDMVEFFSPYRNLFSEPHICEIECGLTLIRSSLTMAERIISTNVEFFDKDQSCNMENEK